MWFVIWFLVIAAIVVPGYRRFIKTLPEQEWQGSPKAGIPIGIAVALIFLILGSVTGGQAFFHLIAAAGAWMALFSWRKNAITNQQRQSDLITQLMRQTEEFHLTEREEQAGFLQSEDEEPEEAEPYFEIDLETMLISSAVSNEEDASDNTIQEQLASERMQLLTVLQARAARLPTEVLTAEQPAHSQAAIQADSTEDVAVSPPLAAEEPPTEPEDSPLKPGFTYQPQLISSRFSNSTDN